MLEEDTEIRDKALWKGDYVVWCWKGSEIFSARLGGGCAGRLVCGVTGRKV